MHIVVGFHAFVSYYSYIRSVSVSPPICPPTVLPSSPAASGRPLEGEKGERRGGIFPHIPQISPLPYLEFLPLLLHCTWPKTQNGRWNRKARETLRLGASSEVRPVHKRPARRITGEMASQNAVSEFRKRGVGRRTLQVETCDFARRISNSDSESGNNLPNKGGPNRPLRVKPAATSSAALKIAAKTGGGDTTGDGKGKEGRKAEGARTTKN